MSELPKGSFCKIVILTCPKCGSEEAIEIDELNQYDLDRFRFFDLVEETESRNIWQCGICGRKFYTERR